METGLYAEKFFKSTFYALICIPTLLIVAFLTLFIITLWYAEIVGFLRVLISVLPLIWIFFSVVVFVIGLLIVLVQIKRTAKEAEKLMETSRQQIAPISHDLTIIVNDLKRIVTSIQQQMGMVEQGVGEIKDTVIRINQFEKTLQEKLQQPE